MEKLLFMRSCILKVKDSLNLIYILSKRIIITLAVLILVFSVRFMVNADNQFISEEDIVTAEKYLFGYHSITLDPLTEEVIEFREIEMPKPEYHTECNYYLYSGYFHLYESAAQKAWRHAFDLYRQGLIHGADPDYQCTFFAQMWFYDVYGFNSTGYSASGNGSDFAYRVYLANIYYDEEGDLKHWFKLDSEPETMGIISISGMSNSNGHVICVDEVDKINGTITFSDGNVTNSGDVRIRVTMSLNEFYSLNPGRYTFVNPTDELLEMMNK